MKMRQHARLMKQRLRARVKHYATEEELFAAVRQHRARMTRGPREPMRTMMRKLTGLTIPEQELLTGITTSGQFTLAKVQDMYAGVQCLRDRSTPAG